MNIPALSNTEIVALVVFVVVLALGIVALLFARKRRTEKLRTKFGGAEYERALKDGGDRRHAEAGLKERSERVEGFHVRPLTTTDRARFVETWRGVQTRFIDGPAGAVAEADQLVRDVMSARGYPVADFDQRAADISVDHPLVIDNYRKAHEIALRQAKGQAVTEDLRQAMIHYRSLFEELMGEAEPLPLQAAS
jgi:hypothetical protein